VDIQVRRDYIQEVMLSGCYARGGGGDEEEEEKRRRRKRKTNAWRC